MRDEEQRRCHSLLAPIYDFGNGFVEAIVCVVHWHVQVFSVLQSLLGQVIR